MYKFKCSNCGKEIQSKQKPRYTNSFCSKKCESEFRKGKSTREIKQNEIIINNDYAIIKIQNNQKGELNCFIDVEDVEKVKNYYWNIRYDKRHPSCTMYVESHKKINDKNIRIHLHRLITDCPSDLVVDHINHNGLDNRKENLRIVTQKFNTINRRKTIGKYMQGVSFDNRRKYKKYNSYFRGVFLGCFLTEIEAYNAYMLAKTNYLDQSQKIV